MGLLDEGKVAPYIVGLTAKAGQARSIAVPDELIEPGGFPHIAGGTVSGQCGTNPVKVLAGVEDIAEFCHQFLRFFPDTAVQVDQKTVEIVVDLEIIAGRLMEEDPAASAEYLDIPLIVDWEQGDDEFTQCFFAADPAHEAKGPVHCCSHPGWWWLWHRG